MSVVVVEAEHCRHLIVVHLIVHVKVGCDSTTLDAPVKIASCEGAQLPTN